MNSALRTRLLATGELLLIGGWIYLLFQWHPRAGAGEPPTVPQNAVNYASLRSAIEQQLQDPDIRQTTLKLSAIDASAGELDRVFMPQEAAVAGSDAHDVAPFREVRAAHQPSAEIAISTSGVTPSRPSAPVAEPAAVASASCPYRLSAIIRGGGRATVVLVNTASGESLFLNPGQKAGDWLITSVGSDTITLTNRSLAKTLFVE